MDNFKVDIFISIDVMALKGINILISRYIIYINSYDIKYSIDVYLRGINMNRPVYTTKIKIIPL
jgi:hypothetical protein